MKRSCICLGLLVAFCSTIFGADLRDVLAHPKDYDKRHVNLVGIARVPGYFHLFADPSPAEKLDFSKGLYVSQKLPGRDYTDLDRQWVRLAGVVHNEHAMGDSPAWLTLERAELLRDRPPPRIKDPTIYGVFQNATAYGLRVDLYGRSFWVEPKGVTELDIHEGPATAFTLKEEPNVPVRDREEDKPIARGEIKFRNLAPDYEYSPAHSDKRTFYYGIKDGKIEQVSADEGKAWKTTHQ